MTTTQNTIEGRPIRGQISRYGDTPSEQKPLSELLDKLDALLAFPEVEAIRWRQWTPYFNDGDVCTFSAYGVEVKFVDGDDEAGDSEDGFVDESGEFPAGYFDTHAHRTYKGYDSELRRPVYEIPEGFIEVDYDDREYFAGGTVHRADIQSAHAALRKAIECGEHDTKLTEHFGDPAEVVATRDGFDVEYYEHD
ncbi:hypothetical protein HOT75_gp121 [Gordonia phage Daredevil]|uniref:Uncharacterized protein n=1 Tax=Gordonia phage Daredevil TaxID=2283286 RepID=A0A345MIX7_9CAUD|nr:hypothetical protein HOT75_gp121 [Gordonia phage Daredevil]AXH70508.1 hypothetical protein SEA_DAREDEVIL_121 [Gordonia phage Daredevil]